MKIYLLKINQRKKKQAKRNGEDLAQDHPVLTPTQNTVERKEITGLIDIEGEGILHRRAVKKDKQKGNKLTKLKKG